MRIACEIITVRTGPEGTRKRALPSKAAKGFTLLGKIRLEPPEYGIHFSVAGDRDGNRINITKNPPQILAPMKNEGKATFQFTNTTFMISKANVPELEQLLNYLVRIAKGENVEIANCEPVKSTDFKPTSMIVKRAENYRHQMAQCSPFLQTLQIDPISLPMADPVWTQCTALTKLTISGNPITLRGRQNLIIFGRMPNLQTLEVKNCRLGECNLKEMKMMMRTLPQSLINLDLSENKLEIFPPIYQLHQLQRLNLSKNHLKYVSSRIGHFSRLISLNLEGNQLQSLPYIFHRIRNLEEIKVDNNDRYLYKDVFNVYEPKVFQLVTRMDSDLYMRDGVDTLFTLAANVLHRRPNWSIMRHARMARLLPLAVRFQVDDLTFEPPGVSALEMCTICFELAFIRFAKPFWLDSSRVTGSIDVSDRYIFFNHLVCMDCQYRQGALNLKKLPILTRFFKGSQ